MEDSSRHSSEVDAMKLGVAGEVGANRANGEEDLVQDMADAHPVQ